MTETVDEETFDRLDPDLAGSASPSAISVVGQSGGANYASSLEVGSIRASKLPWTNSSVGTSRLDMKEIMAQASSNRTSTLSSSLAIPDKPPPTTRPSLPTKLSQRERKKQQQQQQYQQAETLRQVQSAEPKEVPPVANITPEKAVSPWKRTSSGPKVSLKEVIGAEARPPSSGGTPTAVAHKRTPSPMTMRQTVAGKKSSNTSKTTIPSEPSSARPTSSHASTPNPTSRRSVSTPTDIGPGSTPPIKPSSTLSPPRSVSTYDPPIIQSIRHHHPDSSPKDSEPSLQLSMNDILSQQQTEKQLIRDIVEGKNKRSLQEIQTEQAFQEWWDSERKKVQEEEEAAAGKGKGKGRRGGRVKVRARGGAGGVGVGGTSKKAGDEAGSGELAKVIQGDQGDGERKGSSKVDDGSATGNRANVLQGRGRGRGGVAGASGSGTGRGGGQRAPSSRGRGGARHDRPSKPNE